MQLTNVCLDTNCGDHIQLNAADFTLIKCDDGSYKFSYIGTEDLEDGKLSYSVGVFEVDAHGKVCDQIGDSFNFTATIDEPPHCLVACNAPDLKECQDGVISVITDKTACPDDVMQLTNVCLDTNCGDHIQLNAADFTLTKCDDGSYKFSYIGTEDLEDGKLSYSVGVFEVDAHGKVCDQIGDSFNFCATIDEPPHTLIAINGPDLQECQTGAIAVITDKTSCPDDLLQLTSVSLVTNCGDHVQLNVADFTLIKATDGSYTFSYVGTADLEDGKLSYSVGVFEVDAHGKVCDQIGDSTNFTATIDEPPHTLIAINGPDLQECQTGAIAVITDKTSCPDDLLQLTSVSLVTNCGDHVQLNVADFTLIKATDGSYTFSYVGTADLEDGKLSYSVGVFEVDAHGKVCDQIGDSTNFTATIDEPPHTLIAINGPDLQECQTGAIAVITDKTSCPDDLLQLTSVSLVTNCGDHVQLNVADFTLIKATDGSYTFSYVGTADLEDGKLSYSVGVFEVDAHGKVCDQIGDSTNFTATIDEPPHTLIAINGPDLQECQTGAIAVITDKTSCPDDLLQLTGVSLVTNCGDHVQLNMADFTLIKATDGSYTFSYVGTADLEDGKLSYSVGVFEVDAHGKVCDQIGDSTNFTATIDEPPHTLIAINGPDLQECQTGAIAVITDKTSCPDDLLQLTGVSLVTNCGDH